MKKDDIQNQLEQERNTILTFVLKCKGKVNKDNWNTIYSLYGHGEWEMAFSLMLECLAKSQLEIKPNMQDAINNCLDSMKAKRSEYPILTQLNYSEFW